MGVGLANNLPQFFIMFVMDAFETLLKEMEVDGKGFGFSGELPQTEVNKIEFSLFHYHVGCRYVSVYYAHTVQFADRGTYLFCNFL